eukprot:09197.XXX_432462_431231_1 [CDS] Oithona nana genome sequencing.
MSFEENFDAMVYGSTQATEDPEVQKVFELELALPDLTFVEILGDIKAQGAAGFADQLMQDNTPTTSIPQNPQTNIHEEAADHQEPSSLPRTISMEMDTLKSEEHQNLPVEHHPRSEIQSEANVKFQCAGEMQILEPEFATSQYVFKHAGKRPFYEIKGKKVVQLKVSPEPLDQQWIFTGLFHSHPEYCHLPIWAPSKDDSLYSPNTPFNVHGIDPEKVVHLETQVQDMNFNLKIKGVLILLTHDNIINLEYLVNSTDKNNFGQKKNAKEWQQLVVPLEPKRVQEMLNGSDLNLKDLTLSSRIRVQVREEIRKTALCKEARSIEISFPLPQDQRKRRLKEQILQAKKARLDDMTFAELEVEAKAEGLL